MVADFAQCRAAFDRHLTHFAGAQSQGGVQAFACDVLDASARATANLRTFAWLHLDAVDGRTDWDIAQWQAIADLNRSVAAGAQHLAGFQTFGGDNVTAFAIRVQQQRNVSRTIWIIFQPFH